MEYKILKYTRIQNGRMYRSVRCIETGKRKYIAEARVVWEQHYGKIPVEHHIHHKDENPLNNDILNLECLHKDEHWALHADDRRKTVTSIDGREYIECSDCKQSKCISEFYRNKSRGIGAYCKLCSGRRLREWRDNNREHHNQYHREYRTK